MSALAPLHPRPDIPATTGVFLSGQLLTGPQKAAIIVRLLLHHGADLPLTGLPDHQQATLTEQMAAMRAIDRETLAAVVEEFCRTLERMGLSFPEGLDGALKLLDGRLSDSAADRIRRRVGGAPTADPWETIRTADVARLLPYVTEESAEVAAVILAKLPVPKAAEILGQLPGERARRIALSMSRTANTDPETVRKIGLALRAQLEVIKATAFDRPPADRVGAILNLSPAATRDDVLKGIEEADQILADAVRKTIFTFAHIPARIATRDVPKVLKGVDQDLLVKAFGGAKGEAVEAAEFLLANMSQRLAGSLREEIAAIPKFKDKEVEAAQTAIVLAIRELETTGELVLIQPEDEE